MAKRRDDDRIRIVPTDGEEPSQVELETTPPPIRNRRGPRPLIVMLGILAIAVGLVMVLGGTPADG